jgi:soluble lytic murein transglycosylase-like protein
MVGLWLTGKNTYAGPFELARVLVPEEASQIIWQNGLDAQDQYAANTIVSRVGIESTQNANDSRGLYKSRLKTSTPNIAVLMPSVTLAQVTPISHLSDQIPVSKMDPLALDTNLMSSIENQRVVADFFEKKYNLDRIKIEEYVSNAVIIAKEVHIDPLLLLAVMSIESNFNPMTRSAAGAEGLMQVMTAVHKDKYALYGGAQDAVKPAVNIRIGAYILKYLIATSGSLRNGLKFYVGAGNADNDGGYTDKVMAERNRLITLCRDEVSNQNKITINGKSLRS